MEGYFISNFPLLCVCVAMGIIAYLGYRVNKRVSSDVFVILGLLLILSVIVYLESYAKKDPNLVVLATIMTYLGYTIRPVCLYFFVRLADKKRAIPTWITVVILSFNALMYFPSLIISVPQLSRFAFYYTLNEGGTALVFNRGYVNFTSHIISAIYLLYIIYLSFVMLQLKHRSDAFVILTCAAFVVVAVILEAVDVAHNILNISIALSCVFYYLFVNRDTNRRDALTDLFNRKTYYDDALKYEKKFSGIIQIDMNCLKYLNDTKGHEEGDKALKCIADISLKEITKDMAAYRMGGDEFLSVATSTKEDKIREIAQRIKEKVIEQGYSCSIGVASYSKGLSLDEVIKKAEEEMYADKAEFYKNNRIERRH